MDKKFLDKNKAPIDPNLPTFESIDCELNDRIADEALLDSFRSYFSLPPVKMCSRIVSKAKTLKRKSRAAKLDVVEKAKDDNQNERQEVPQKRIIGPNGDECVIEPLTTEGRKENWEESMLDFGNKMTAYFENEQQAEVPENRSRGLTDVDLSNAISKVGSDEEAVIRDDPNSTVSVSVTNHDGTVSSFALSTYNVNARFEIGYSIDLRRIIESCPSAEFKLQKSRINHVMMKYRNPKGVVMIHPTGKCVAHSCTSEQGAFEICRRVGREIRLAGYDTESIKDFYIANVFSKADLGFSPNMVRIKRRISTAKQNGVADFISSAFYDMDAESSNSMKIKLEELHVTMRLFPSGVVTIYSIVLEDAEKALQLIYPLLNEFKDISSSSHHIE